MNLFDHLVAQAMTNSAELAQLQPVVEKELLHHDILREMSQAGLLSRLVFIGGTCLRACYGSQRLSEDLDFAGGSDFERSALDGLAGILEERLFIKYGLDVLVSEPVREEGNVATWKMRMATRPERKDLPGQRINIDICAVAAHDRRPVMLRNFYGVEMGTSGLILQAASREEILADKFVALAFRPNRLKHRDLWDILWLKQQGIDLPLDILANKLDDHKRSRSEFVEALAGRQSRIVSMAGLREEFVREMRRFLPVAVVANTIEQDNFWAYLVDTLGTECRAIGKHFA